MSSRQMGTWPQLIGCALFEIWSLISDGELRSRGGYSTGRMEAYENLTENREMVPEIPEHLRGRTGRLRRMGEAESGGKVTIQYSDCRSTQSTSA